MHECESQTNPGHTSTNLYEDPQHLNRASDTTTQQFNDGRDLTFYSAKALLPSNRDYRVVDLKNSVASVGMDDPVRCPPSSVTCPTPTPSQHMAMMKSISAHSLSRSSSDVGSKDDSNVRVRVSSKEAIRVIINAVDAQINSVQEMLGYFTKLVKAEKAVQQALLELIPERHESTSASRSTGTNGSVVASTAGFHRLLSNSSRRRRSMFSPVHCNSTDTELNGILHGLVSSTNHQARAYSTRALFHKVVTAAQLESLITCHQCLKRTYMECETELQSQAHQYATNIRTCERKYAKYAEQMVSLRAKVASLCDKRVSYHRKTVEVLMNNLEAVTRKLHLIHNDYLMVVWTANHFQQWLHTQLRPCLLNGIERTMQLTCEVVRHLLVFGGETVQDSSPSWLMELQVNRNLSTLLEQHGLQFPPPVQYEFNAALLHNVPAKTLSPTSLAYNDLTRQSFGDLMYTYRNREMSHRQTVDQITRECLQWEEALAQWRAVFAIPLPNPWLHALSNDGVRNMAMDSVTSTASSVVNSSMEDGTTALDGNGGGWPVSANGIPDIQELWHDDRARPVNLCEVSYRLTVCEFELRFATCLAEAHAELVSRMAEAQNRLAPNPLDLPNMSMSFDRLPERPPSTCARGLPDLLETPVSLSSLNSPRLMTSATSDCIARSTAATPEPSRTSYNGMSKTNSMYASDASSLMSARPNTGNRLWNSFRYSMSRLRSHFTRSGPLRSSLQSGSSRPTWRAKTPQDAPANTLANNMEQEKPNRPKVIIEREYNPDNSTVNNGRSCLTPSAMTNRHLVSSTTSLQITPRSINNGLPPLHSPASPVPGMNSGPTTPLPPGYRTAQQNCNGPNPSDDCPTMTRQVDINKEPWFHGVLPRTEVERLLQNQGDFLVRQTNKRVSGRDPNCTARDGRFDDQQQTDGAVDSTLRAGGTTNRTVHRMVLSVYWHGHKHFILCGGDGAGRGWYLENGEFPSIRELLEYHILTGTPVTAKSGACLITPVTRPDWELDNKDVQLVQKIGQGNFGDVYRGYYNGCEVAVKTCRGDTSAAHLRQKFLQGERTALNFCHPHIVKLIGIAVHSHPIMIVMEYVPGGSLLTYLRRFKNVLSLNTLLLMASDAASGMAYLESKNCIHRDLAARNCLVTETGRLKIADFGMSREEHIYELSDRRGQIPIKWTAPEALVTGRYTIKCDVWSYGVLLWEIFTFGDIPYRFWSNPQTREMVESGYRLPPPENMPPLVRIQMNACWLADAERRPSFAELSRILHFSAESDPAPWTPSRSNLPSFTKSSKSPIVVTESRNNNGDHNLPHKFARLSVKDKRTREN
ncbi:hypothetical protein CRM22_006043 [Opisthorchis felineus]|uniref:Tyrosine-protein kinase n=1 Tax=Opisthorchis felineus TaxID=147828 RepID=A0A4S2LV22_OPIFE|nr:hypothetical protein CRM22_006043 [Opisthorchis felineus]